MDAAMAAMIVAAEHARATRANRGKRGGHTCAHNLRQNLLRMQRHFGFPCDAESLLVEGAAPGPKEIASSRAPGAKRGAASLGGAHVQVRRVRKVCQEGGAVLAAVARDAQRR